MIAHEAQTLGRQVEGLLLSLYPQRLAFLVQRPVVAALAYLIFYYASHIIFTHLFGVFAGTPNILDFVEDTGNHLVPIALCATVYYYFYLPMLMRNTFDALAANKVFETADLKLSKPLGMSRSFWLPHALTVLAGILWLVWNLVIMPDFNSNRWWRLYPEITVFNTLVLVIAWVALFGLILNVFLTVQIIRQIFRDNSIQVYRLHPDGSGGFAPLGRFSLRIMYLALIFGVFLAIWAVQGITEGRMSTDYLLMFLVVLYVVCVLTLFYLPLHLPHLAMVAYRDKLARETSSRYLEANVNAHLANNQDAEMLSEKLKYMEGLQNLSVQERSYPVWPFNTRIRLTVLFNALVPVIPTVLGFIVDLIG